MDVLSMIVPNPPKPEDYASKFMVKSAGEQLTIRRKDGTTVEVQISVSEGQLSSKKKFYAAFIRDLTGTR